MTVYIDADFKCHVQSDGTRIAAETDFFNGKCTTYIEGYRFVPEGQTWIREDGGIFQGEMIAPFKPYAELDAAQRAYEQAEMEDMKAALQLLGVNADEEMD